VPEFFVAKFIICNMFPDKPGEGLMQVTGFKIWHGYNTDAPHDDKVKLWICKNVNSKSTYNDSHLCF
jgi:hypothetical protein